MRHLHTLLEFIKPSIAENEVTCSEFLRSPWPRVPVLHLGAREALGTNCGLTSPLRAVAVYQVLK